MCLFTEQYKTKKELKQSKQIADRDIRVYKVLSEDNNSTPYMGFKYEKGYQYFDKISKITYTNIFGQSYYRIERGLHTCISYKAALSIKQNDTYNGKIVTMYIPKGSEYYKGIHGDIVSNQLVWY